MEIPLYVDGNWGTCVHPLADEASGGYEELLREANYSRTTQFHPGGDTRSVVLTVWGNDLADRRPKYLVDVEFHPSGAVETVAAASLVDLMNLLTHWAPVVQTALLCDEAAERWERGLNEAG
uniref:hypothetical protein n=1 Tax=Micromonospora carbonacea TaxID=47853 RepID=UPI003B21A012